MTILHASWQAYYLWLQDRGQIWPRSAAKKAAVVVQPPTRLRIGFLCKTSNQEEAELLSKMIAATKLRTTDFKIGADQVELLLDEPEMLVILGDEVAASRSATGEWQTIETPTGHIDVIATYHPRELLRSPTLKREAWSHLQSVMERLRT